jgi:hypothetical protein
MGTRKISKGKTAISWVSEKIYPYLKQKENILTIYDTETIDLTELKGHAIKILAE